MPFLVYFKSRPDTTVCVVPLQHKPSLRHTTAWRNRSQGIGSVRVNSGCFGQIIINSEPMDGYHLVSVMEQNQSGH